MKTTSSRIGCVILAVFLTWGFLNTEVWAEAPGVKSYSLEDVKEYAVQNSYEAQKSLLGLEAAQQKVRETVAGGLPQISSSINYNNNLKLATSLIPNFFEGKPEEKIPVQFGTQHNASASITVDQLIFNGSYFVGLQTSKIYKTLAEQGILRTRLDILETVTSTYFTIMVAEESERILLSNLANLEQTHYEIQERYKEGFVEETDVDLLQISVTQLKNGLQTIKKQKEIAYKLLNYQMGLGIDEKIELTENLEDILSVSDIQASLGMHFDLERNIDYQLLLSQEKLAGLALKNEKAKYWPKVSAFFTYQQNAFRDSFNFFASEERWFPLQILGININIPLFKSGEQKARVGQAQVSFEQARVARAQASEGLRLESEQAKADLSSLYENYLNVKANMQLSKKVYDVTLVKYKEGVSSSLDLTQSNDKFLSAQSEYIKSLSDLLNAKNKLDRLMNNY